VSPSAGGAASTSSTSALEGKLAQAHARIAELEGQVTSLTAAVEAAVVSAASGAAAAPAEGGSGASEEEVKGLKERIAELEASEAKLKKAVAALSA